MYYFSTYAATTFENFIIDMYRIEEVEVDIHEISRIVQAVDMLHSILFLRLYLAKSSPSHALIELYHLSDPSCHTDTQWYA